jgi:acetylornithine deacetylase
VDILERLVGFPSVSRMPNGEIVAYVRDYLAGFGLEVNLLPGPEGDRTNLFASIGPRERAGYILSAHLDVVPAPPEGWGGDPFVLRRTGDRLVGRGAVDMKGFVACVLAAVPAFLSRPLAQPIHLAFSYDEEVGCVGVRHLIPHLKRLCAPPLGCLVGEPTGMQPVLRHKGKAAARVTVRGRAGHSSRPDLAENAIHPAAELILAVRDEASRLAHEGPFDARFEPAYSTLQVGTVRGGIALNVVPDSCVFEVDARAIPGCDPASMLEPLRQRLAALRAQATQAHRDLDAALEILAQYPALDLADDHPLAALSEEISGQRRKNAVSFGTEAGLYQAAGIPSIVCGPGDIARAHTIDEYIRLDELAGCERALAALAARLHA